MVCFTPSDGPWTLERYSVSQGHTFHRIFVQSSQFIFIVLSFEWVQLVA